MVVGVHGHVVGGREAGDHLVEVHVRRGAGPGLEDVEREGVGVLTVGHLVGGPRDRGRAVAGDHPEVAVHRRRAGLQQRQGADEPRLEGGAGDREVLDSALGLRTPERVGRDLDLAEGVVFGAGATHEADDSCPVMSQ